MSCDATVSGADPTAMRRSHGMMKERFNSRQLSVASPRRSPAASYCFLLGSATSCKTFFFKAAWTVLHPEPQLSFSLFPLTAQWAVASPAPSTCSSACSRSWNSFEGQLWASASMKGHLALWWPCLLLPEPCRGSECTAPKCKQLPWRDEKKSQSSFLNIFIWFHFLFIPMHFFCFQIFLLLGMWSSDEFIVYETIWP